MTIKWGCISSDYRYSIRNLKRTQTLRESELKNSRFLSINNLIESSKRLQANKRTNENEMIKLIIKDNQNSKNKLINIKQNTLASIR